MGRLSLLLTLVFALTLTATAAANAAPGDTLYIQSYCQKLVTVVSGGAFD